MIFLRQCLKKETMYPYLLIFYKIGSGREVSTLLKTALSAIDGDPCPLFFAWQS